MYTKSVQELISFSVLLLDACMHYCTLLPFSFRPLSLLRSHMHTHSVTNLISQPTSKNDLTSQESVSGFIKSRRTASRHILLVQTLSYNFSNSVQRMLVVSLRKPRPGEGPTHMKSPGRVKACDEVLIEPFGKRMTSWTSSQLHGRVASCLFDAVVG